MEHTLQTNKKYADWKRFGTKVVPINETYNIYQDLEQTFFHNKIQHVWRKVCSKCFSSKNKTNCPLMKYFVYNFYDEIVCLHFFWCNTLFTFFLMKYFVYNFYDAIVCLLFFWWNSLITITKHYTRFNMFWNKYCSNTRLNKMWNKHCSNTRLNKIWNKHCSYNRISYCLLPKCHKVVLRTAIPRG